MVAFLWVCMIGVAWAQSAWPECNSYNWLREANRAPVLGGGIKCDREVFAGGWYRFGGDAGNNMLTSCPATSSCGTSAPGWVDVLPSATGQLVNAKVCFHWSNNCCRWQSSIQVRNCGGYNVYKLPPPPACNLRVCGNGEKGTPAPTTATPTQLPTTGSPTSPPTVPPTMPPSPAPTTQPSQSPTYSRGDVMGVLATLMEEVLAVKSEISELQRDMSELKGEVSELSELKSEVSELNDQQGVIISQLSGQYNETSSALASVQETCTAVKSEVQETCTAAEDGPTKPPNCKKQKKATKCRKEKGCVWDKTSSPAECVEK